jgi:acetolactate synthase-1/2/3 large subunit
VDAARVDDEPTRGVHPARAVLALHRVVGEHAIVTNDAGNFSGFLHRHWWFGRGGTLLGPANGAMGYAVPAAVAAKLVAPDATVVAAVGDGGVLMTGTEIETAARLGLGIVVVVFQNGLYGTIAMHQARGGQRLVATDISFPDLGRWAEGLGASATTVDDEGDLEPAFRDAVAAEGPALVAIRTDPDVIAPGTRLSELIATF